MHKNQMSSKPMSYQKTLPYKFDASMGSMKKDKTYKALGVSKTCLKNKGMGGRVRMN